MNHEPKLAPDQATSPDPCTKPQQAPCKPLHRISSDFPITSPNISPANWIAMAFSAEVPFATEMLLQAGKFTLDAISPAEAVHVVAWLKSALATWEATCERFKQISQAHEEQIGNTGRPTLLGELAAQTWDLANETCMILEASLRRALAIQAGVDPDSYDEMSEAKEEEDKSVLPAPEEDGPCAHCGRYCWDLDGGPCPDQRGDFFPHSIPAPN